MFKQCDVTIVQLKKRSYRLVDMMRFILGILAFLSFGDSVFAMKDDESERKLLPSAHSKQEKYRPLPSSASTSSYPAERGKGPVYPSYLSPHQEKQFHATKMPIASPHSLAPTYPEGYPYQIHGYLKITYNDKSQRILTGTLIGPSHVLVGGHHFANVVNSKELIFYPLTKEGKILKDGISAAPLADAAYFNDWEQGKNDTRFAGKPIGGAAIVTLDCAIGNLIGYADLCAVSKGSLQGQIICLGGIHGPINYAALEKGNQRFTINITTNTIESEEDSFLQVANKPGLAQQAEVMLARIGERYAVIGLGRGAEDEEHIFQRLTEERLKKLKEAVEKFKPINYIPKMVSNTTTTTSKTTTTVSKIKFPNEPKPLSLEATEEDLEGIIIIPDQDNKNKGPNNKLAKKIKVQDSPLEHHPDPTKDRGNLRHMVDIYLKKRTFMRYCYLLLKHAYGFHPLAEAMLSVSYKFCQPHNDEERNEERKRDETLGGFFDLVLRELSLLHRYHAQETDLTPSDEVLAELTENQADLIEVKSRLEDVEELFKTVTGDPLKRLQAEKQDLLAKKKGLEEKISPVVDKSKLAVQQEELLSDDQKEERELVKQPKKLNAVMESKYKEELEKESKKSELEKQAEAAYLLGQCYLWGWGCKQDFDKAMIQFEKASSSQKCPKAYEILGHLHAGGIGVKRNNDEAIKYYTKFAEVDSDGYLHLAHFEHITDSAMGNERTLEKLRRAAEEKNPIALRALSTLEVETMVFSTYEKYINYFKDKNKELVQPNQEAERDNKVSKIIEGELGELPALGKYYYFGRGGEKNDFLAALCFALYDLSRDPDTLTMLISEVASVPADSQGYDAFAKEKLVIQAKKDNCYNFVKTLITNIDSIDRQDINKKKALKNLCDIKIVFLNQLSQSEDFNKFLKELCVMLEVSETESVIQQLKLQVVNLLITWEAKERFQQLVQRLAPFLQSSGKNKELYEDSLQLLENLANKKMKKMNNNQELSAVNFELFLEYSRWPKNQSYRQALGHCFMWGWSIKPYELCHYGKAATVFTLATKKKQNYEEWGSLCNWLRECRDTQRNKVSLKEKDNWLGPDNRYRTLMMNIPLKTRKLDALVSLARLGYPVGFYNLGKDVMKDAPTFAFECFTQASSDPKAASKLAELYFTVEGIDGKRNKKKKDQRTEAFTLWQQAALQGVPAAQFYLGNCYLRGWGTERDNEQASLWLEKAYQNGYVPSKKTIPNFTKPYNPLELGF